MDDDGKRLTAPQVQKRYNIAERTLWRWEKQPELGFPQPIIVNRRKYYSEQELVAWERAQAAKNASAA